MELVPPELLDLPVPAARLVHKATKALRGLLALRDRRERQGVRVSKDLRGRLDLLARKEHKELLEQLGRQVRPA